MRTKTPGRQDDRPTGKRSREVDRRGLLLAAGVSTAAAALPEAAEAAAPPDEEDPRAQSYRETDHIRWFYARARM